MGDLHAFLIVAAILGAGFAIVSVIGQGNDLLKKIRDDLARREDRDR